MLSTQRILLVAMLALALPAFAQHGRSGSMGGGPPAGAGAGMGADHGMSGDHTTGPSQNGSSNSGQHVSMASQSPDSVLSHNTAIAGKIKDLTGQDATAACSSFKNLGQCVAAAHVSKNLGISFTDLKSKVTGDGSVSLGKAIKELKPAADSKAEAKKANKQAQDLKTSSAS
jgi:hypothetical protein